MSVLLVWFLSVEMGSGGPTANERGAVFTITCLVHSVPAGLFFGPIFVEAAELLVGETTISQRLSGFSFWLGCFLGGLAQWSLVFLFARAKSPPATRVG